MNTPKTNARNPVVLATGVLLFSLPQLGCRPGNIFVEPPPPEVTVAAPLRKTVQSYLEETGTTEASDFVEIRARVKGFLEEIKFEAGQEVTNGFELYVIERAPYEAALAEANANLEVANANYANTEARYQRGIQLNQQGALPKEELDQRKAERDVAQASISAAKAQVENAQINLDYTIVTSPVDGRVGKTLVYQGNLVGDGTATHLTTVVKYDPIFAVFSISEQQLLDIRRNNPDRDNRDVDKSAVKMLLQRAGDESFPFEGHLDFADLAVDQSTGTYTVRGVFANPQLQILPGLFVRIRIPGPELPDAMLVPEQAVGFDQAGRFVMVVNNENKVERRDVTIGVTVDEKVQIVPEDSQQSRTVGRALLIASGIQPSDRVVVNGLQRARPGAAVDPQNASIQSVERSTAAPSRQPSTDDFDGLP